MAILFWSLKFPDLIADGEGKDARTNDKWLQAPRFKDARLLCEQWYPIKGGTIRARIQLPYRHQWKEGLAFPPCQRESR
jgi:hypothetical protein